jgi:hypothetical protein
MLSFPKQQPGAYPADSFVPAVSEVYVKSSLSLLFVFCLLLVACQPATAAPSPVVLATNSPPVISSATPPSTPDPLVQQAIDMLSQQFNIPPAGIAVSKVTPMTWPDRSLGCPKIGVLYIPEVTSGYEILLEANAHIFTIHTAQPGIVVLCSVDPPDEAYPTP